MPSAGLYYGTAGIAISIIEGIQSGLIINDQTILTELQFCLQNKNYNGNGMVKGIAGQGMALLRAIPLLGEEFVRPLLEEKIQKLLDQQQKDGSWIAQTSKNKHLVKVTGFGHGVAGIACFLTAYSNLYKDNRTVQNAAMHALEWLIQHTDKIDQKLVWPSNTKVKTYSSDLQDGSAGVILALIKGYEVFQEPKLREYAKGGLQSYSPNPVQQNITLAEGLTGIGEVFLEAATVFGSEEYHDKASWIAQFLLHYYQQQEDGSLHWFPDGNIYTSPGLLMGNTGIIHFLLRSAHIGKLSHPSLPI
jgi:hypothetical protein